MTLHKCPIPGCPAQIEPWKLLCALHWNRVPGEIQVRVYNARRLLGAGDKTALGEHRAAARAAIMSAKEKTS